jgi:hypothetical protein
VAPVGPGHAARNYQQGPCDGSLGREGVPHTSTSRHTQTHRHTHSLSRTTFTHTSTPRHTQTLSHAQHSHTQAHPDRHTDTNTLSRTTFTHKHTQTDTQTHRHSLTHNIHTHKHTQTHTDTNTLSRTTFTHKHTCPREVKGGGVVQGEHDDDGCTKQEHGKSTARAQVHAESCLLTAIIRLCHRFLIIAVPATYSVAKP